MVTKLFTSDGQELEAYLNSNNQCFIQIGTNDRTIIYSSFIVLNSDDLGELISELQSIKKQIDSIEENG